MRSKHLQRGLTSRSRDSSPFHRNAGACVLACILLASDQPRGAAGAHSVGRENDWTRWSSLRLKVHAMPLVSGRVWMHVRQRNGQRVLETESTARLFGATVGTSRTETLLDETGMPIRYTSYNEKRGRRYIFGEKAYRVERLAPRGSAPIADWRIESTGEFPYPRDDEGQPIPVFDYYAMLLHLRSMPLDKPGDQVRFHIATSDGPLPYRVEVAEIRAGKAQYKPLNEKYRITAQIGELRLRITPDDPERAGEGFLNMEGETEIWVERQSKTILRISGKVPKIPGRVHLVLAEMG